MESVLNIQPAECYDEENGGKIPIFRPSLAEFENFENFVKAINPYGLETGIVKIVPPKEWHDSLPALSHKLAKVRIRRPIVQHIFGSKGIYTQTNVEKRRIYTLEQWHNLCLCTEHQPHAKKREIPSNNIQKYKKVKILKEIQPETSSLKDSEIALNENLHLNHLSSDEKSVQDPLASFHPTIDLQSQINQNSNPNMENLPSSSAHLSSQPLSKFTMPPPPPYITHELNIFDRNGETASKSSVMSIRELCNLDPPTDEISSILKNKASNQLNNDKSVYNFINAEFINTSPPYMDTTSKDPNVNAYEETQLISFGVNSNSSEPFSNSKTSNEGEEVEIPQTLSFDYHCLNDHLYNVQYCKDLERSYWRNLTFNQPMYGADMSGTLFDNAVKSWNVGKLDNILNRIKVRLPGVNTPYLYFGMWKATFSWHVEDMDLYSINYLHFGEPKQWYSIPSSHRQKFEQVMQSVFFQEYKNCPQFLRHKTFLVSPTVLSNYGIPVNRMVQHEGEFIITFPFGYHSGYNLGFNCAESVNFAFESWIEIGKKAESCHCMEDSVKIDVSIFENNNEHIDLLSNKLDNNVKEDIDENLKSQLVDINTSKKKSKIRKNKLETFLSENSNSSNEKDVPEISVADNKPEAERKCVLCPNPGADLATEEGRWAHRICAEYIPDTRIIIDENNNDIVIDISLVPKGRWKLKCQICNQSKGACIQCCKGKCIRAFHATCAVKHRILVNSTVFEDGSILYEVFCNVHNPKYEEEKIESKLKALEELIQNMTPGKRIWAKWTGSSFFPGIIEETNNEKQICKISFEDGYNKMIPWCHIRFEEPITGKDIKHPE